MCGEIEDWQIARTVQIRLTSGAQQQVTLNQKFEAVEEIRLTEFMITNFNGGVSAMAYLNVDISGATHAVTNNTATPGMMLMMDVLNPHTVYSNPATMLKGNLTSVNSFGISLRLPTGAAVTFTEAVFTMTFVCRRSPDSLAEIRALKAQVTLPSVKDGAARNMFNPDGRIA